MNFTARKMNPKELVATLLAQWKLLLIAPLLAGFCSYLVVLVLPKEYVSEAVIRLSSEDMEFVFSDKFLGAVVDEMQPELRSGETRQKEISVLRSSTTIGSTSIKSSKLVRVLKDEPNRATVQLKAIVEQLSQQPKANDISLQILQTQETRTERELKRLANSRNYVEDMLEQVRLKAIENDVDPDLANSYQIYTSIDNLINDQVVELTKQLHEVLVKIDRYPDRSVVQAPSSSAVAINRNPKTAVVLTFLGVAYLLAIFLALKKTYLYSRVS